MDWRAAPALLPALGFLIGLALEPHLTRPPLCAAAVGAVLAVALRRPPALAVAGLLAGLAIGTAEARPTREALAALSPDRPVTARGRVVGPWQRWESAWAAPLAVDRLRQGDRVVATRARVQMIVGGEGEEPPRGSLAAQGFLGRSRAPANLVVAEPGPWRLRVKSQLLLSAERPAVTEWTDRARRSLPASRCAAGGERCGWALARALLLGDTSDLPMAWKRGLRRAGLYHLLSVSGVHVSLVAAMAALLFSALPLRWRLLAGALAVALFVQVVGPFPALLRAALMGLLGLLALVSSRRHWAGNALAVAAIVLAAREPELVRDLGFQLSFAATAGLVWLAPAFERLWPRWAARTAGRALLAGVAAQVATLPFALPTLPWISWAAPLANLIAIPWTGLFMAVAWVATWSCALWPRLLPWSGQVLDLLARPVGWTAQLPPSPLIATPFPASFGEASCLAALLLLPLACSRRGRRLAWGSCALVAAADLCQPARPAEVELVMLDVGQGESLLLRDGRRAVLIDGGGARGRDVGGLVVAPALARLGVFRLDAAVLTHPDLDHCGGLLDLVSYLPVRQLWLPASAEPAGCVGELMARRAATLRKLAAGDRLAVGRWDLEVLSPAPGDRGSENDRSLVVTARALGQTALLAGDLEASGERRLVARRRALLRSSILKVGHHGSATSTTQTWLEAVSPRLALLSCGAANRYGHPARDVLRRLAARRALLLRTDRHGLVRLRWQAAGPIRVDLPSPLAASRPP